MTEIDYRSRMEKLMHETLGDEAAHHDWAYRAVRPISMPSRPWHSDEHVTGDCSKGCQFIDWWSDIPVDPMGQHFGPYGNSATYAAHLQHLAHPSELLIGDMVTFGAWGSEHATKVMVRGSDPILWSFGHQGAPNQYRLSQDRRVHQLLRVPVERYVPTKAEILRSKTGYWSWLQWRLGEGDWQHYPASTASVRPNVPKVISPEWWVRYKQFIANRHSGNESKTATPMKLAA